MLRRMKIGGRLNLLIGVPLVALALAAAVGAVAVRRASVNGDDYRAAKQAQDLRVQASRPDASLLSSWADASALVVIATDPVGGAARNTRLQRQLTVLDTDRKALDASLVRLTALAVAEPAVRTFVKDTRSAEQTFFDIIDTSVRPAIDPLDVPGLRAAVASLDTPYEAQRVAADRVSAWAKVRVLTRERSTDDAITSIMLFGGAAVVLVALLTLLLSVRVRRSIVRPMRAMATRSQHVASVELPAALAAIRAGEPAPAIEVIVDGASPEIAELGASFASLSGAAVEMAVGQVAARQAVADSMVNIARRSQALLGRTLGLVADLERDERDPDTLDQLFRLDHLATRMRRNAQSLLVLAGAEPTRMWSAPVPMGDVVRAALSEIENYTQVDVSDVGDVRVAGTVAADLSHLLAELLENATTFAPPTSMVTVIGRAVADGHQLAVYDYGIGMSADDLAAANRRLAGGSVTDGETSRQLGFQVVGRLAARHGIVVSLAPTPGGSGVTAVVRLPGAILDTAPAAPPVTALAKRPAIVTDEVEASALPKRVRGASLVDETSPSLPRLPDRPSAEQMRSSLGGLQRGVERARTEETRA